MKKSYTAIAVLCLGLAGAGYLEYTRSQPSDVVTSEFEFQTVPVESEQPTIQLSEEMQAEIARQDAEAKAYMDFTTDPEARLAKRIEEKPCLASLKEKSLQPDWYEENGRTAYDSLAYDMRRSFDNQALLAAVKEDVANCGCDNTFVSLDDVYNAGVQIWALENPKESRAKGAALFQVTLDTRTEISQICRAAKSVN